MLRPFTTLVGALVLAILLRSAAMGQTAAADGSKSASKKWTLPRTPDGHPDLQGIWSNAILTPLERPDEFADRPVLTKEEAAAYERQVQDRNNVDRRAAVGTTADVALAYNNAWYDRGSKVVKTLRTSLIIDPSDGRIPALTPDARRRATERDEARRLHPADGPEDRSLNERCLLAVTTGPPMLPGPYNNNYQLVETPNSVVIFNEMEHEVRTIATDGRPHLPPSVRLWKGDSVGRWERDTLVVDTTNFTDKTNFRGASEKMHLIERFTRIDADTLRYSFTVDDPISFVRPWTAEMTSMKTEGPILEYACHEGNYAMTGILSAARAEERKAGEKTK